MTLHARHINGVDTEAFENTCSMIKNNPELAKTQFRLHNQWCSGGHNKVNVKDFYAASDEQHHKADYTYDIDEPPVLLGSDKGANPVEYLLTALSSCMTTSIIYHAAAKGIKIESLKSDFYGDIDLRGFLGLSNEIPKGYQKIDVVFKVKTDASAEELTEFYKFSPVYAMLSRVVPIEVKIVKE